MTVRYERVEPCEHGADGTHFQWTAETGNGEGCPGGSRTILEPTEIRWCETHGAQALEYCWRAAFTDPLPDDAKRRCSIVSALLVLPE